MRRKTIKARKFLITVYSEYQRVQTVGVHAMIKGEKPTWEDLNEMTEKAGFGPSCAILFMMEIDPS